MSSNPLHFDVDQAIMALAKADGYGHLHFDSPLNGALWMAESGNY